MIVESFFFRVLGVGYSKRGLSSFCVFVISRNEMPVTSYFGYSGTNPMFTVFLKTYQLLTSFLERQKALKIRLNPKLNMGLDMRFDASLHPF